jgi:hypothetical protein
VLTERLFPPRHRRRNPHTTQLGGQWFVSTSQPVYFGLTEPISVCSEGHHPDPHHRDSDIWQGIVCCWDASCKKCLISDLARDEITHVPCVDAKQRPEALGADVAGVGKATSGSVTDKLTREHRLTLDEAHLILNTKREDQLERVLTVSVEFLAHFRWFADE